MNWFVTERFTLLPGLVTTTDPSVEVILTAPVLPFSDPTPVTAPVPELNEVTPVLETVAALVVRLTPMPVPATTPAGTTQVGHEIALLPPEVVTAIGLVPLLVLPQLEQE
jgi:hypothetical protein